jgi:hypothetical protein
MKPFRASMGVVVFMAGCGRSVPSSAPSAQDASVAEAANRDASATTALAPVVCDLRHMQVFDMVVTPLPPARATPPEKFDVHVRGCGFYIGAQPWVARLGDQQTMNVGGNENDLEWSLEKEPAVGDELFVGYGAANVATGIRYAGLGKQSIAPTSQRSP